MSIIAPAARSLASFDNAYAVARDASCSEVEARR